MFLTFPKTHINFTISLILQFATQFTICNTFLHFSIHYFPIHLQYIIDGNISATQCLKDPHMCKSR
jgi:hypothetical protein